MATPPPELYDFGPFRLDVRRRLLLRQGRPVTLKPKAFDLLLVLVNNAGQVIGRDELIRTLWPDTVVTEANLTQNVWMLRRALEDNEDSPRYIGTLPRRGYEFLEVVTRVCPPEPTLLQEARGEAPEGKPWQWWRRNRKRLSLLALALAAVAVGYGLHQRRRAADRSPTIAPARRSIAVLGFKNLSGRGEEEWLSTALSEMLTTELAAGGQFRLVAQDRVARMSVDLSLLGTEKVTGDALPRVRTYLAADLLVLGSYAVLGKEREARIRLDVRTQDALTRDVVTAVTRTGAEAELFDLVASIGARLRQELGAGELSAGETATRRAAFPSRPEAARLYAEGLAKLWGFEPRAARSLLEKAAAAEPDSALVHSALAGAWSALGYEGRAKEEAKRAFDLSGTLPREERLLAEARYRAATREWDRAVEIYGSLWAFFPDDLEHGLRLASAQSSAGKLQEALATVEALRRLPPPSADDPRIDLAEATAALWLSDSRRARTAAAKAVDKGTRRGAPGLVARGWLLQGWALRKLGEANKALAAFTQARDIFEASGDGASRGEAIDGMAVVHDEQGDFSAAKTMYARSLATYREIGERSGAARALNGMGVALLHGGDLGGARRALEEAARTLEEIGETPSQALVLSNVALVLGDQGDLAEAKAMQERALAIHRQVGNRSGMAVALNNIALLLEMQGELAAAKTAAEEALAIGRETGDKRPVALSLHVLAMLLLDEGDLAGASTKLEESLAISREIGARRSLARTVACLARLRLRQGERAGAQRAGDESLATCRATGDRSCAAVALFELGDVLLTGGDLAGARRAHEESLVLRDSIGEKVTATESRLALAALSIEEGRAVEAERLAREASLEFKRQGRTAQEAAGHEILARAWLGRGDRSRAARAIERARSLLQGREGQRLGLVLAITAARLRPAGSQAVEATRAAQSLEEVRRRASGAGDVALELEARLALAEIERRADAAGGHARLEALEREAMAKGFGLVARKAADARPSRPREARPPR